MLNTRNLSGICSREIPNESNVVRKGIYTREIKKERYANSCLYVSSDKYANKHFKKAMNFPLLNQNFQLMNTYIYCTVYALTCTYNLCSTRTRRKNNMVYKKSFTSVSDSCMSENEQKSLGRILHLGRGFNSKR
jgi:hypothetical protein